MTQPELFAVPTSHCFFGGCRFSVTDADPDDAHARMERHYAEKHGDDVDARTGRIPTETWCERALRLAQEVQAARPDPFKSTPKQREHYAHLRYALFCHLEAVPGGGE